MRHYVDLPVELNSDTLITCDDDVETSGLLTDEEIVNLRVAPQDQTGSEEPLPVTVTANDAFCAMELLKDILSCL